ncbi:hypothetical protein SELMODRAFT_269243 [Selaginella moellendorffii]|uniref:Uncharacterized protein CAT5-2 n=1 Tax=Selaginella moellendorffii TaxID=88036 RepID=D8SVB4_SELML|nr:cationic amino acid transporter 1 [Selaginella moellendorffii]XP_024516887.1 cationic amino acid transporter 1 [Selaginella moellendorffii]EFJ11586.1 hypothetical protein SELMODRAFT_269243 [Selaginella moellendorffii]|eukprot:XP_002987271.1 cationic amino acid transporter 1 [Selaginella moellendorffii]
MGSNFLPEESFQSWSSYVHALSETRPRFMDRLRARSSDQEELLEVKSRSKNEMIKTLNWWDLMWFGIGAVIGAGVFVLTGQEAKEHAGPAIILSYAVAGLSAMLSVFCYTEFAVEIPVAGGSFAYLRVELGDFAAFIAAGNIVLEYIIGNAAVARSWTGYFAALLNHDSSDFRIYAPSLAKDYNYLDPIAVVVLCIAGAIACYSTRHASTLNWIASVVNMLVIAFIIVAGLTQADTSNYTPFMPGGVRGLFSAASVLFFAYLGFDAVSTMAEETKNPGRDIPLGLLASMTMATVIYCLMALTLSLMTPNALIDKDAPFSVAFKLHGMNWAQYLVALGALKGMTTVLLVGAVGQARYLTHIARTHMIPPWFAVVNGKTSTPVNATAVMVAASAIVAFFSSLGILANLLSISTLFIFSMVAMALLVRRYYVEGVTSTRHALEFVGFMAVILASSIAIAIYWAVSDGWIGYVVAVPVWFLATAGLAVFVPTSRKPKVWGVPLVPWLPSLSIATNIFLLGSIDTASFVRFAVWTGLMLLYYVFFGLHASYDVSKEKTKRDPKMEEPVKHASNDVEAAATDEHSKAVLLENGTAEQQTNN